MGRGGAKYISYTALVLLSAASSAKAGLWHVDIDLSPAPAPADGPPFSFHATRDRSLLPYQIIGVVGAYIACVLVLGSLLLTVGRRARRRAQDMAQRPIEMVKLDWDQTPVDGESGWLRRVTSRTRSMRSGMSQIGSPGGFSTTSFDHEMHEQNKQRDKLKLADLYGAVYGDEDRKNASTTDVPAGSPPRCARNQLPPLTVNRPDLQRVQTADSCPRSPLSPTTPRSPSVRAIYPPDLASPRRTDDPVSPRSSIGLPRSPRDGRTASFGSNRNSGSPATPAPQKVKKGIRNLRITRPLGYDNDNDNEDGLRTLLSPGAFETSDIAPAPPTGRTNDSQYPPTTPGTGKSFPYPEERLDEVRDLPQAYPQRIGNYQYDNQAQALTDAASQHPDPISTMPQNKRGHANAGNIHTKLPFRTQFASRQPGPPVEPCPLSPSASWQAGLRSPGHFSGGLKTPDIKERVLEYNGRQHLGVPYTGQLAGEPTPYSPYMPGGLVTPVSARPQTRLERKQREKEMKAVRGAATDADQVADEKDLWSSGY